MNADGETPAFDLMESALDRLQHVVGCSLVVRSEDGVRLVMHAAEGARYHNAQLDDYSHGAGERLRWQPPLRLRVRPSSDPSKCRGPACEDPERREWYREGPWRADFTRSAVSSLGAEQRE